MTAKSIKTPRLISPYSLIQEKLRDDPWKLLVACIMLNQTSATQARPVWDSFFKSWRWYGSVLKDLQEDPEKLKSEMTEMIRPLGFQNRRAERIIRMTQDFDAIAPGILSPVERVAELYGVGKYASDSYRMFFGGVIITDVEDKELKNYVKWALSLEEKREE